MSNLLRRALLPSLEIFLFILVFYISLFFMPDMFNSDGDLPRHITVGNMILDTHMIPLRDEFSHTRLGEPVYLHEWLVETLNALVVRAAGLNGIAWLTALLLALIYSALAISLRLLGTSAPLAFAAGFAAYLTGAIHQLPRPHLFGWLYFIVLLLACEMFRRTNRKRWLAALVPLLILWANSHASYLSAFIVLGIFVVGALMERAPRRAAWFALTIVVGFAASLLNPNGISVLLHFSSFLGNRFLVDTIVEYLSPNFHNLSAYPFAAWILFSILLLGRTTSRVAWTPLLLLCAWTALGLYSARNIATYAFVACFVTMPLAQEWLVTNLPALHTRLQNMDRIAPVASGWVWSIGIVALLISLQANGARFDLRNSGNVFGEAAFPIRAVDFVTAHPPSGNMFNEYTWGGYLLYRLYPAQRVFIDGTVDLYGEELTRDYLDIMNAREGWEKRLEKYNVAWVIVPPSRALAKELARSENWRDVYQDEGAGVWVRK